MRASKKSTLNLTPLLDVILILLFVFMMMLASQQQTMANNAEEYEENAQLAEDTISELTEDNKALEEKATLLESENAVLSADSQSASAELNRIQEQIEQREATLAEATKALADFIGASEQEMENALQNGEEISAQTMEDMTQTDTVTESLLRYTALSQEFYFIEVELRSKLNRVYINGESTSLGIGMDEIGDKDGRDSKIEEIEEVIEEALDERQGGSAMTFIILKVHDDDVYQKAWDITWEAIGEIQEKYGTDSIFRTHITLIKN